MGLFLPQPPPPDSDEEEDPEGADSARSPASIPMDEGICVFASQMYECHSLGFVLMVYHRVPTPNQCTWYKQISTRQLIRKIPV